jgi:hypothetical protein
VLGELVIYNQFSFEPAVQPEKIDPIVNLFINSNALVVNSIS